MGEKGKNIILVTKECSSSDYIAANMVQGVLTQRGGSTSDFAILLRDIGKTSVLSCENLIISEDLKSGMIGKYQLREGDIITLNGKTGEVFEGDVPKGIMEVPKNYEQVMDWANTFSRASLKVNAFNIEDVKLGKYLGAKGVGVYRTEACFLNPDRLKIIQTALFTDDMELKKNKMEELVQLHKGDVKSILTEMNGYPCYIRMLDNSLNAYIPPDSNIREKLSKELNIPVALIHAKYKKYAELSPSLGMRGVRMAIVHPEIFKCQTRAIFLAGLECLEKGGDPQISIEFPVVSSPAEYLYAKEIVREVAKEVGADKKLHYKIGILMEIPRAAFTIDEVAKEIDFIHFGTNDLTQMTCGFSRKDSSKFISNYVEKGMYAKDPFVSIDENGVGELIKICMNRCRKVKPNISFAVVGEHARDPQSIKFFNSIGIHELSCSPEYFAIAKFGAAQAALKI